MWKVCRRCQTRKQHSEFPRRCLPNGGPGAYCFPCQSEYSRAHYQKYGHAHNARRRRNQKRYIARNQQLAGEYLRTHPCVDCGESDAVVLEFDHVRDKKRGNVSEMVLRGVGWAVIAGEIAKCEVRCANCHRSKTARQRRFQRLNTQANGR